MPSCTWLRRWWKSRTRSKENRYTNIHTCVKKRVLWRTINQTVPFVFILFYLHQKSSLVDVPMLQFSYAYTQRYVGNYNAISHISFCKTILHMLMFIIISVFCVKYFSSGSAGKYCYSPRSVAGVCSTQPRPTWALLTAGVSFCIISTYSILLLVLLYYKILLGSAYTNSIRAYTPTLLINALTNNHKDHISCCEIDSYWPAHFISNFLLKNIIFISDFSLAAFSMTSSIGSPTWTIRRTQEICRFAAWYIAIFVIEISSECMRDTVEILMVTSSCRRWLSGSWRQWVGLQGHLWSRPAGSAAAWRSKFSHRCALKQTNLMTRTRTVTMVTQNTPDEYKHDLICHSQPQVEKINPGYQDGPPLSDWTQQSLQISIVAMETLLFL